MTQNEKNQAAYALNLWTVSISQIIDYNDMTVVKQEYDNIINNTNLENMPKDEALLDVVKRIIDQIVYMQDEESNSDLASMEYQHQVKNAIWSAVPALGGLFASGNPNVIALSLATQVGIGYMNYRRKRSEIELDFARKTVEIEQGRFAQLINLRKALFEAAWRLAGKYEFHDEFRLSEQQISNYNAALMEPNDYSCYVKLNGMRDAFQAYPPFWYQIGSAANRLAKAAENPEIAGFYRSEAGTSCERYKEKNVCPLLRNDSITAAWALEYVELLELNSDKEPEKAFELIYTAEKNAGNSLDILEICAWHYLRIKDYLDASRLFLRLVNEHYNADINTQVLSCIYLLLMQSEDSTISFKAKIDYKELYKIAERPEYIITSTGQNLNEENVLDKIEWIGKEDHEYTYEFEKNKQRARVFYQKATTIDFQSNCSEYADLLYTIMDEYRSSINLNLPPILKTEMNKEYHLKQGKDILNHAPLRHIVLFAKKSDAINIIKTEFNADITEWDYSNYGISFVSKVHSSDEYVFINIEKLKRSQREEFQSYDKKTRKQFGFTGWEKSDITHKQYILAILSYLNKFNAVVVNPRLVSELEKDVPADEKGNSLKQSIKELKAAASSMMNSDQTKSCSRIIHSASIAAGVAGAIPIPVADAIPISAAQITMVVSLGKTFGIKITEGAAKAAISATAACFVGRNLVKFIPVGGWVVSAVVAAGVTEAIGWSIAADFAKQYRSEYDQLKHEESIEEEIKGQHQKVDSLAEEITYDSDIGTDDDSDEEAMDPGDYV